MIFNMVGGGSGGGTSFPQYTYTGNCQLIDDGKDGAAQNWRLKLLTSGTLTFTEVGNSLDVFLLGGGGGGGCGYQNSAGEGSPGAGGGGGYTMTSVFTPTGGQEYEIVIGAGGEGGTSFKEGSTGGTTSAFGMEISGGKGGGANGYPGGNGGSGGGGVGGAGGSDGSDGASTRGEAYKGKGQGSTTREFGESTGDLYAGGGGAGYAYTNPHYDATEGGEGGGVFGSGYDGGTGVPAAAVDNTGGGGGGGRKHTSGTTGGGGRGGSGIVVIRNHRG